MLIRRRFSAHEGGTKAYQVIEISADGVAATVCQYGKFKAGDSVEGWPAQIDLKGPMPLGVARRELDQKVRAKSRRGYTSWDSNQMEFRTADAMEDALKRLIGPFKAESVMNMLSGGNGAAVSDAEPEVDPENVTKGSKKAPAPRTEESTPEWATW
ncbi:hypothetical protein [Burkholderia vietnamiensis]|uniref:hypothetical protein n=1 Tax=Burkholderia vietnamiensis TaxID=60552 RepID=UPI001CAB0491|nr:hypothetical protein [Burkholderia vietnamiensis]CAG9229005.1 hypothetical protein BVI1335_70135 [Burkholderia vietnamiensis]HDR9086335.1 hypothetical protein [Burkholderia vietnamiensis]